MERGAEEEEEEERRLGREAVAALAGEEAK